MISVQLLEEGLLESVTVDEVKGEAVELARAVRGVVVVVAARTINPSAWWSG